MLRWAGLSVPWCSGHVLAAFQVPQELDHEMTLTVGSALRKVVWGHLIRFMRLHCAYYAMPVRHADTVNLVNATAIKYIDCI